MRDYAPVNNSEAIDIAFKEMFLASKEEVKHHSKRMSEYYLSKYSEMSEKYEVSFNKFSSISSEASRAYFVLVSSKVKNFIRRFL